jgi:hypothetical protein
MIILIYELCTNLKKYVMKMDKYVYVKKIKYQMCTW